MKYWNELTDFEKAESILEDLKRELSPYGWNDDVDTHSIQMEYISEIELLKLSALDELYYINKIENIIDTFLMDM